MAQNNWILLATVFGILGLLVGGIITYSAFPKEVTKTDIKYVEVPVSSYDDTAIKADISTIKYEILKEDTWKTDAENLAIAEFNDKGYKDIFNALVDEGIEIDYKADIKSVAIINDETEVSGIDIEDKDAEVTQELKVYYENSDGDDKKVYLIVTTEIEEGEVTDQEIVLK